MPRDRRPNRMRYSHTRVMGAKTQLAELIDPEIEGRVENAHTGLSPRECDELRAKRDGTKFMPIEEAERLRRARPAKKLARKMDLGEQLLRLAQAAAGGKPLDAKGAANLDASEELDPKSAADDELVYDDLEEEAVAVSAKK